MTDIEQFLRNYNEDALDLAENIERLKTESEGE